MPGPGPTRDRSWRGETVSRADLDDTFLVITAAGALTRSDAGIEILRHLTAPWRWLVVLAAVPRPLRDGVYDIVARRRYRWFGRRENCTLVPASERHRMIGVVGRPPADP